jgi:Rps23 Pro-64 3,4-dihydroxylase Tpa1-like proline 4-hydroxylase
LQINNLGNTPTFSRIAVWHLDDNLDFDKSYKELLKSIDDDEMFSKFMFRREANCDRPTVILPDKDHRQFWLATKQDALDLLKRLQEAKFIRRNKKLVDIQYSEFVQDKELKFKVKQLYKALQYKLANNNTEVINGALKILYNRVKAVKYNLCDYSYAQLQKRPNNLYHWIKSITLYKHPKKR